jgi:predicted lipoprotein with Yx(FWY)xxD motif
MTPHRFLLSALVAALLVGVAADALASSSGGSATGALTVRTSAYGKIVFDGRGFALYAFTRDRGKSACAGACATAWPPFVVTGGIRAGPGVKAALLGTVRRANGARQVTYAGRPLYYYVGDRRPGQVLCQNVREFGGLWLVVRPNGKLVRSG